MVWDNFLAAGKDKKILFPAVMVKAVDVGYQIARVEPASRTASAVLRIPSSSPSLRAGRRQHLAILRDPHDLDAGNRLTNSLQL